MIVTAVNGIIYANYHCNSGIAKEKADQGAKVNLALPERRIAEHSSAEGCKNAVLRELAQGHPAN